MERVSDERLKNLAGPKDEVVIYGVADGTVRCELRMMATELREMRKVLGAINLIESKMKIDMELGIVGERPGKFQASLEGDNGLEPPIDVYAQGETIVDALVSLAALVERGEA